MPFLRNILDPSMYAFPTNLSRTLLLIITGPCMLQECQKYFLLSIEKIACYLNLYLKFYFSSQKVSCIMPDDLRNFYLTSNGLSLKWNVKMNGNQKVNFICSLLIILNIKKCSYSTGQTSVDFDFFFSY